MSTEGRFLSGSTGVPVVGDTVDLSRDIFGFYEQLQEEYGRIASYQVFGTNACMIADPDAIERILLETTRVTRREMSSLKPLVTPWERASF